MIDSHAHLNDEKLLNITSEIVESAIKNNIKYIVVPGYDLTSSRKAIEIAEKYDFIYASVGIHPENIKDLDNNYLELLEEMSKNNKVVAIGEIGLDYYWTKDNKEEQKRILLEQLYLAKRLNLPVIIHMRDATEDFINLINESICANGKKPNIGVMHSYSGSKETMNELIKAGFYISFSGPVTYKNSKKEKEAAINCPLDKILVETDSPYLPPSLHRGEINKPEYVIITAKKLCELKNISYDELEIIMEENFKKLFLNKETL